MNLGFSKLKVFNFSSLRFRLNPCLCRFSSSQIRLKQLKNLLREGEVLVGKAEF